MLFWIGVIAAFYGLHFENIWWVTVGIMSLWLYQVKD